jgi:hypothetical protein
MQDRIIQEPPFAKLDRVITLGEAAAIAGVSLWTLKRRSDAGKLKILRLSPRRIGVRLSEIERYLTSIESA